jgi:putative nucleotidyltransferase with HDIG domain
VNHIEHILAKVRELPPLPDTVLRLVRVINNPDSSAQEVVECIRYDQAATAEILRICNSPFFGIPRGVHSLMDATRYLGTMRILQLVMTIHSNGLLSRAQPGYELAQGMLWRHSVAVAIAASALAQRMNEPAPGVAFTAGLLHDIGKVVLSEFVGESFHAIVDKVEHEHLAFSEAEQQVLNTSHAEIGAELARRWKLPETMVQCIAHHHDPDAVDPPEPLVDAVHLADTLALMLGVGIGADELHYRARPAVLERNKLRESDLEAVGVQMLMELRTVEKVFDVPALTQAGARR